MTTISLVSMRPVSATRFDREALKLVSLFSCCGLAASICLLALGVDLSPPWL